MTKAALVTGGSQGIGLAIADALIDQGMGVLVTSRTPPPACEGLFHLRLDMTEPTSGQVAVDAVIERFGQLDVLVNNVGTGVPRASFSDQTDADWLDAFALNLVSAVRVTRSALPYLLRSGGVVVNVSSVNGHLPATLLHPYNATKAAMNNLTVGLSNELAFKGVRVVAVGPGPITTPLWLRPGGVAAQFAALMDTDPQSVLNSVAAQMPIRLRLTRRGGVTAIRLRSWTRRTPHLSESNFVMVTTQGSAEGRI